MGERPWITEDERASVQKECEDISAWLDEKEESQAALKLSDEPAFSSKDVRRRVEPLQSLVVKMMKKRKPRPKKKKKIVETNSINSTSTEEAEGQGEEGEAGTASAEDAEEQSTGGDEEKEEL